MSINEDIERLKDESGDVVRVIRSLKRKIYRQLQDHHLTNGSRVQSRKLSTLTPTQRRRVLTVLHGLHFEITETHTQYKVVWDEDVDRIYVVEAQLSPVHICIPRPQ